MSHANGSNVENPEDTRGTPEHLNSTGVRIGYTQGKGRGVYACREIPSQTLIEISPVLLFTPIEYEAHGKHTVLDHYTFVWRDGRMALALGLGSLFNHSQNPNVSYLIDQATESIRYVTSRRISKDEELCIFYGHKLWFDPVDTADGSRSKASEEKDDVWGGLSGLNAPEENEVDATLELLNQFTSGKPDEMVPEDVLPFKRMKMTPEDEEEEDMDAVRKEDAWIVDLPEPRLAAAMLKWLKQSGLDTPTMSHLKRIRKIDDRMSMILVLTRDYPVPPAFPDGVELPPPYVIPVPKTSALTMTSLKLKSTLWPTIYAPRKKYEPEPWSRGKVRWACEAMKEVVREARRAGEKGELPVAAHVPVPYDEETKRTTHMLEPISAHDTRKSVSHPLRHSIINLVRTVGELRAASSTSTSTSSPQIPTPVVVDVSAPSPTTVSASLTEPGSGAETQDARNGAHYLLTSLSLFTTHEPCIMCSMALLHSRVKEVFYLVPMPKTGGCGGVACVPRLEGVNHRYAIGAWKLRGENGGDLDMGEWAVQCGLGVDDACDA